jgi:hypothetical protein
MRRLQQQVEQRWQSQQQQQPSRGLQRGQWLLPLLQPPLPPLQPQSHRVQPLLRRRQQHRCSRGGSQGQVRRRRPPPPLRVPKQQRG